MGDGALIENFKVNARVKFKQGTFNKANALIDVVLLAEELH